MNCVSERDYWIKARNLLHCHIKKHSLHKKERKSVLQKKLGFSISSNINMVNHLAKYFCPLIRSFFKRKPKKQMQSQTFFLFLWPLSNLTLFDKETWSIYMYIQKQNTCICPQYSDMTIRAQKYPFLHTVHNTLKTSVITIDMLKSTINILVVPLWQVSIRVTNHKRVHEITNASKLQRYEYYFFSSY